MDIKTAFEFALSGRAILFVGAGFSVGAENLRGQTMKTGKKLAKHFSDLVNIEDEMPLDDAAEEFISAFGKDKLIAELHAEFTAKTIAPYQIELAKVPWRRIYTTNYDNVLEKSFAEVGKKLNPITLNEQMQSVPKENTICVHLNGYIDRLNRNTLLSEFKLTDSSYSTASIADSTWSTYFRDDIKAARAVFFIGYSLADLDIKRMLFPHEEIKEKSFFVIGGTPSKTTFNTCARYGNVLSVDASDFAETVKEFSKSYVAPLMGEFWSSSIEKYKASEVSAKISDQDIFDLFLQGNYKPTLIQNSLQGGGRYYIERDAAREILEQISYEASAVVIHSELGNGKSLFIEGLKHKADLSGFEVYTLVEKDQNLFEDLNTILNNKQKKIIIIDNYPDWMEELRYIENNKDDRTSLILASRSATHDALVDRLGNILSSFHVKEISVDKLSEKEIAIVSDVFTEFGLWGENAALSKKQKIEILTYQCESEFHAILLELLKSPNIISKLDQVVENLRSKREYYRVIVSILILNVLNIPPTIDRLVDYWGRQVLDASFRQDVAIQQMIDFKKGKVILRSSVVAKHILQRKANADIVVDTMLSIIRKSDQLARVGFHNNVRKLMVRFSNIQELLPPTGKRAEIIRYYESVKNLPLSKNSPLFWLQYAIACLVLEEFDRAKKYFDTAYSLANSIDDYDLYQIENQYARFLLIRATKVKVSIEEAMSDFSQAHKIIYAQSRMERLHFPYRVAEWYVSFFDNYADVLRPNDKEIIVQASSDMIARIRKLPKERQMEKHVRRCEGNLQELLEKVAGV